MYRGLKLLSEEAKKREISGYYKKCKQMYDEAYFEWRDVKKQYLEVQA